MKKLILNENKMCEYIIETGDIGTKPGASIYMLARYFIQTLYYSKDQAVEAIHDMMKSMYPGYVRSNWTGTINDAVAHANDRKILDFDGIPITHSELVKIRRLENKRCEKLAFTLLVLGKYYSMVSGRMDSDHVWVNSPPNEVFNRACVSGNAEERAMMYAALTRGGLIAPSMKTGSYNAQIVFADFESDMEYLVTDMENIGNEYLITKGDPYTHCKRCGVVFRDNRSRNSKYCKNCKKGVKLIKRKYTCIDCGREMFVMVSNTKSTRCPECQKRVQAARWRESGQKYQEKVHAALSLLKVKEEENAEYSLDP